MDENTKINRPPMLLFIKKTKGRLFKTQRMSNIIIENTTKSRLSVFLMLSTNGG